MRLIKTVAVLLTILSLISVKSFPFEYTIDSPEIKAALDSAGENSAELEKVLSHYQNSGDSLKYQAALYLVANMEEHCYVTYRLYDSTGSDVPLQVLSFPDYKSLLDSVHIIEKEKGEIDYEKLERFDDLKMITADFLIDNIDLAFKAWRDKPWSKNYSFDIFEKYILPYRGSNEPLEEWRTEFLNRYAHLEEKMNNPEDPIEAASLINDEIKEWFHFDERYYFHPTDQGLSEMMENKLGRCEDMTNLTIFALRANGLPVTSDYTPHWANSGNNHAWNSIVHPDGMVVPFMGAEANPGNYRLNGKVAKVYRKSYAQNKSNLIFQEHKQEKIPRWLAGKSYIDVTPDYTDVTDFTVKFDKPVPDSVDVAYICVFNSGKWRPIDWAKIEDNKATFHNVGTDVAYIAALYTNEEVEPFSSPFILTKDKQLIYRVADTTDKINVKTVSTTRRKKVESTEGTAQTFLKPGTTYELYYYDYGWQPLGELTAEDKPLLFDNAPSRALYWLVAKDSDREERIFTIDYDGNQIWW